MEGYCGQKDVMGLPHGRGTLILDPEEEEEEEEKEVEGEDDFVVVFQGHFRHGVRHGRGTLSFCDVKLFFLFSFFLFLFWKK